MKKAFLVCFSVLFLSLPVSSQKLYAVDQSHIKTTTEFSTNKLLADTLSGLFTGVVSGLISSLLFLGYLSTLKPKILISEVISKEDDPTTGTPIYKIKVVNKTDRPIVNIKLELSVVQVSISTQQSGNNNTKQGVLKKVLPLKLKRPEVPIIREYRKSDSEAEYACRFSTTEQLDVVWVLDPHNPNTYLEFTVFAMDSRSNFSTVAKQRYYKKNQIVHGAFEFGDSLKIS